MSSKKTVTVIKKSDKNYKNAKTRNNRNKANKQNNQRRRQNRGKKRTPKNNFSAKGRVETRTEFIQDITVSNQPNFNLCFNQSVNPGLANVFPWASRIAPNYDKYHMRKLQFTYKPMVSEFALAGQAGKVIMAFDYDATDSLPTNKRTMEDTATHADGMAHQQRTLTCMSKELYRNSNAKYVREGPVPPQGSILDFDVGQIWVATEGILANGKIGELWVTYSVEFSVPVLESGNSAPNNRVASMVLRTAFTQNSTNSSGAWQPALYDNWFYNGLDINSPSMNKFDLAPGVYLITVGTHFDATDDIESPQCQVNVFFGPRGQAFGAAAPLGFGVTSHYLPITVDSTTYDVNIDEIDLQKTVVWIEDGTHTIFGAFATSYDSAESALMPVHNYITIVAL